MESKENMRRTHYFLRALTEPHEGAPRTTTIPELGEVKLYVYLEKNAPNRVAYMRKPMILVEDKGNSALSGYAAVFVCDTEAGNDYLADMETPAHDSWHQEQARNWSDEQKEVGRKVLKSARDWVKGQLRELGLQGQPEAQDVIDLSEYLPAEEESAAGDGSGSGSETLDGQLAPETGQATPKPVPRHQVKQQKSARTATATLATDNDGSDKPSDGLELGGDGDGPHTTQPGCEPDDAALGGLTPGPGPGKGPGEHPRVDTDKQGGGGTNNRGSGGEEAGTTERKPSGAKARRIALDDVAFRSFALSPQQYQIILNAKRKCRGRLALQAIGEMGHEELQVRSVTSPKKLMAVDGEIHGISLKKGQQLKFTIEVESSMKLSIGVRK